MQTDGYFSGLLRSQGNSSAGSPFAKQFAGDKNLMALEYWYSQIDAQMVTLYKSHLLPQRISFWNDFKKYTHSPGICTLVSIPHKISGDFHF
jgi:hypothetical protein